MRNTFIALQAVLVIAAMVLMSGCTAGPGEKVVPRQDTWGIYELDLVTQDVRLVYSSPGEIFTSVMRLNNKGDNLVFVQKPGVANEIYTINIDGKNIQQLTKGEYFDAYPAWSPDGNRIAFLSKRDNDLDIYVMDADGKNPKKLYDSGSHDADIDWVGNYIVFTSGSAIWKMKDDGTEPVQITNPANAGQRGITNLPIGDYDPRLSPDGSMIIFERLEDPSTRHGNYNIFIIGSDGTGEKRLTDTSYAQGMANWAHSGDKVVYIVAAIEDEGKYDMYMMNLDGTDNHNITPDYFPEGFLCHSPCFSPDDSKIYFIGQWWEIEQ